MRLSTKARYGARAMLDIAINYEKGPVSLKSLAKRQGVSVKYMEQLIPLLKVAGLIRSVRGAGGGYALSKDTHQIKMRDIIDALEGSMFLVDCVDNPETCDRSEKCVTHELWKEIQDTINNILGSLTLDDMVKRQLKINKNLAPKNNFCKTGT
ncbi:MAG: Rrf2 family transcriptional regulator [Desulfobacteraceae bacterium]|nr:Rrf2 family transcriptional regulator [Pseudomonadota bacterium]MBU4462351.1 Rrf2 family transcriptional regulator [Pseudomonadota bacterium]MCG2754793.1 Rrf2 family transcriptional regulator [Desulfobacteraceae bacterium]